MAIVFFSNFFIFLILKFFIQRKTKYLVKPIEKNQTKYLVKPIEQNPIFNTNPRQ